MEGRAVELGTWEKDDQIGALNLITAAKRRRGSGLVKKGFPVSLAGDVDCNLEALAAAAAARNQWEFLPTAAPLPVRGATGSPLNPVAVF